MVLLCLPKWKYHSWLRCLFNNPRRGLAIVGRKSVAGALSFTHAGRELSCTGILLDGTWLGSDGLILDAGICMMLLSSRRWMVPQICFFISAFLTRIAQIGKFWLVTSQMFNKKLQ